MSLCYVHPRTNAKTAERQTPTHAAEPLANELARAFTRAFTEVGLAAEAKPAPARPQEGLEAAPKQRGGFAQAFERAFPDAGPERPPDMAKLHQRLLSLKAKSSQGLTRAQTELAAQRGQRERAERELAEVAARLEAKTSKLAAARAAGQELRLQLAAAGETAKAAQAQLKSARDQLQSAQAQVKAERAQLKSAQEEARAQLKSAQEEARAQRKAAERALAERAEAQRALQDEALARGKLQASRQRAREALERSQASLGQCTAMLASVDKILEGCSCLHQGGALASTLQESRQRIAALLASLQPGA